MKDTVIEVAFGFGDVDKATIPVKSLLGHMITASVDFSRI
jgi:hypothetical protein